MTWYQPEYICTAHADLSHGKSKRSQIIEWDSSQKVKEKSYISFPTDFMNQPKKLWKIDKLYQIRVERYPTGHQGVACFD